MTNVFDNASSIIINNKEVASISIEGDNIYEKPSTGRTINVYCSKTNGSKLTYYKFILDGDIEVEAVGSQGLVVYENVSDGEHTIQPKNVIAQDIKTIIVDEDHTSFDLVWEWRK